MSALGSWSVAGSYLEACNCDVICPCRRVGGRQGGRSSYGVCMGALSWSIDEGAAAGLDLAGLRVVIVCRYDDDEPGSPWDILLYLDESADEAQRGALSEIWLGHAGGTPLKQFPWAFKPSRLIEVRTAVIELDHSPRRGWFRAGGDVEVRITAPVSDQEPVTCIIPGHDRAGEEVFTDLRSSAPALAYEFTGRCGYAATFAYSS